MNKNVLIVGTGLGGLATGLRLASKGQKVVFIEKNKQPGGRLNQLKKEGFTFDVGPSFFSMPYEFEELIEDCGLIDKLSAQFEDVEINFKEKFTRYLK